jgi:hypothetical protein
MMSKFDEREAILAENARLKAQLGQYAKALENMAVELEIARRLCTASIEYDEIKTEHDVLILNGKVFAAPMNRLMIATGRLKEALRDYHDMMQKKPRKV